MKKILFALVLLFLLACKNEKENTQNLSASDIVNKSIEVSGGNAFATSTIDFEFRNKRYVAKRQKGKFLLMRIAVNEENDSVFDILTNDRFERFKNDELVQLKDSIKNNYKASVNSVHYFSVLPYGLNDKAVQKEQIGEELIHGKKYYKIQVTFGKNGGGEDYEDVFIYWIESDTFKVDYLAYSYNEANGTGMRFRKSYNERYVKGLRFVDYYNYKPIEPSVKLVDLGALFEKEKLEMVSKIELYNIKVNLLNP